jgi:hypothetical protein
MISLLLPQLKRTAHSPRVFYLFPIICHILLLLCYLCITFAQHIRSVILPHSRSLTRLISIILPPQSSIKSSSNNQKPYHRPPQWRTPWPALLLNRSFLLLIRVSSCLILLLRCPACPMAFPLSLTRLWRGLVSNWLANLTTSII